MNLFNIQQQYLSLANELSEGELTPELEQALIINETELKEKAVNYAYVIKQLGYEVNAVAEEIKRLQDLKKRNEKAIERMETAISKAMQLYGIDKVDSSFIKLSFRKSESVEIVNEAQLAQLSDDFMTIKTTRTPNKVKIKDALKAGEVVEGAVLVTNFNLQIK
jgi:replicative superfamily II helicase